MEDDAELTDKEECGSICLTLTFHCFNIFHMLSDATYENSPVNEQMLWLGWIGKEAVRLHFYEKRNE